MTHARQTLLDVLVTAVTGLTTTQGRVFTTHNQRLIVDAAEVPCLLVFRSPGSTEDVLDDADGLLMRRVRFVVQGIVKEAADSEETLDTIAEEVETAVPRALGDAIDCILFQTRFNYPSAPTDREAASVELEYLVTYRTAPQSPGTAV